MSFIFKQMLNNITTDIDALKLEDINIGLGGAVLGEGIANVVSALGDEVTRALGVESGLTTDLNNLSSVVSGASISSAASETLMQAEIDALKNPINNIFSMIKTNQDIPNIGVFTLYTRFNTTIKTSPYITYVAPNINTGGINTGCICQQSGYYKIEYCFNAMNMDYPDRVNWYTRIMINNASIDQRTFIYTRANNFMYVQHGSASGSVIKYCNQNDYIQLLTLVAKNSRYFNDSFDNLRGDVGSNIIITYLGN